MKIEVVDIACSSMVVRIERNRALIRSNTCVKRCSGCDAHIPLRNKERVPRSRKTGFLSSTPTTTARRVRRVRVTTFLTPYPFIQHIKVILSSSSFSHGHVASEVSEVQQSPSTVKHMNTQLFVAKSIKAFVRTSFIKENTSQ